MSIESRARRDAARKRALRAGARVALAAALLLAWPVGAKGELTIRITEGIEAAEPIAIVPFRQPNPPPPVDISQVVANDLARSGFFDPIPFSHLPGFPSEPSDIDFADWRRLGAPNMVIGAVDLQGAGQYKVEFRLYDVFKAAKELGYPYFGSASDLRSVGHRIADLIYEHLTGIPGAFDTSIAYITETKGPDGNPRYALNIADSDGFNKQSVLESPQPILSPAWSPDGKHLAYVSFEAKEPHIYIQTLATVQRRRVADFPGLNNAPAWSPNGRELAMTLSRDGNPEIYVLDLASNRFRRLTQNTSIDTEPAWSPDGKSLVFTSDRSGKPQIYRISALGGEPERLTFEGNYNARATYSPDGKKLALVHGQDGAFRIALLDLENLALQVLTNSRFDESPSFAPNGSMILYATTDAEGASLAAVSVDGRFRQRIAVPEGRVREPAWSPFRDSN